MEVLRAGRCSRKAPSLPDVALGENPGGQSNPHQGGVTQQHPWPALGQGWGHQAQGKEKVLGLGDKKTQSPGMGGRTVHRRQVSRVLIGPWPRPRGREGSLDPACACSLSLCHLCSGKLGKQRQGQGRLGSLTAAREPRTPEDQRGAHALPLYPFLTATI